ncbi:hypothetical protein [Kalamiella sp. sgz302252]|uniref:hypothetical protein n=1 Tax=Pantoea sp. sgz302252 TaxID=3341827 RepID=UPI0036D20BE5
MKYTMAAIRLMFFFFLLTTLTLFFIRIGIAIIFFIKNGYFYFEWVGNIIDSLKRGAVIGSVLGIGVLFLSNLKNK